MPDGRDRPRAHYELSGYTRESLIYTKDRLQESYPGESGRDPHREV